MKLKHSRHLLALPLAAALLFGACGDDDDPTGTDGVTGTYTLQTVNGANLPFIEFGEGPTDPDRTEITGITLTLRANGSLTGAVSFREFEGGTQVDSGTDAFTGTYTRSGNTVTLNITGDAPLTATVSGNTLTFTADGDVYVFTR